MALVTRNLHAEAERDRYFELVQQFPLRPIRSDDELLRAIEVINSLIGRGGLDSGEQDYLDVLTNLVEKYEADEVPMQPVSDGELIKHLIEARGITQSKLATDLGIAVSTINEVIASKRRLTRPQVGLVSRYFSVSASVFSF
jgi:HTH-type transcriptional regulator/antitoxin HigA